MSANSLKLLIVVLFSFALFCGELGADGAIGYVSPKPADFGNNKRPPIDFVEFLDEFTQIAYDNIQDAGTSVMRRNNYKNGEVSFRDIVYKGVLLIPEEENLDMVEDFYQDLALRKLEDVAQKNKVDFVLYSRFDRSNLRRILRNKPRKADVILRIFAYNAQSSAKSSKYVKVSVDDILSAPDYDREAFQDQVIKKYEEIFEEMLGQLQVTGSGYSTQERAQPAVQTTPVAKKDEAQSRKEEQIQAAQAAQAESDEGDW